MGNLKKKIIETATDIFSHIYNLALSLALNFLSFSKQSLLRIEKYENREVGGASPPRVPRFILIKKLKKPVTKENNQAI